MVRDKYSKAVARLTDKAFLTCLFLYVSIKNTNTEQYNP